MAYSDFTIPELVRRFGLTVVRVPDLFGHVLPVPFPPGLADNLRRFLPLGLAQRSEKGRSELLVAPVLAELTVSYPDRLSFFSGIDFTVDPADGLSGRADYILSERENESGVELIGIGRTR